MGEQSSQIDTKNQDLYNMYQKNSSLENKVKELEVFLVLEEEIEALKKTQEKNDRDKDAEIEKHKKDNIEFIKKIEKLEENILKEKQEKNSKTNVKDFEIENLEDQKKKLQTQVDTYSSK